MTDTSTRAAFLADIIAHPEDDTPRLIFADWLEEHDEPDRAEFIRVGCRLAKLCPSGNESSEFGRLERRENHLLSVGAVIFQWLGEWHWQCASLCGSPTASHQGGGNVILYHNKPEDSKWKVRFTRGFLSRITCTSKDWQKHGPAIVREHPVEYVELSDCSIVRRPHIRLDNTVIEVFIIEGWMPRTSETEARKAHSERLILKAKIESQIVGTPLTYAPGPGETAAD